MKYDNKLQEEIIQYMNNNQNFHNHGYTGTHFYNTWEKGKEPNSIKSKKPHGDKDNISASVLIYSNRYKENEKYGVEFRIDMYMFGYQSEETVFQGWAENLEEFKIIIKAVGL